LQSSTEHWTSCFALTIAAVHWCCVIAQLYEEQISIGVIAQACCEPDLQRDTEQWGSCFALNSAGVHWCCIAAHLWEEQIHNALPVPAGFHASIITNLCPDFRSGSLVGYRHHVHSPSQCPRVVHNIEGLKATVRLQPSAIVLHLQVNLHADICKTNLMR
jgi:hypothetical protein